MHSLKQIREILGISQQELADYLGVTRTLYSMAETRKRSLPAFALLKISALVIALNNDIPTRRLQKQTDKDIKTMRSFIQTCTREAVLAKRQLQQLETDYRNCLHTLMAVDHLQATLPEDQPNRKDQLWLELLQRKTLKRLFVCGPAEQAKKKLKADAMKMQVTHAKNMSMKLTKGLPLS